MTENNSLSTDGPETVLLTEAKRQQWRTRALKDLFWFAGVVLNYGERVPMRDRRGDAVDPGVEAA